MSDWVICLLGYLVIWLFGYERQITESTNNQITSPQSYHLRRPNDSTVAAKNSAMTDRK